MKTICIIPCGKKKIWEKNKDAGPTPARAVYIGSFANKCREYAERFFSDSYLILSAKYGFLFPHEIIPGPYNTSFNDKKTRPITEDKLISQAREKRLLSYKRVVVIGGMNYIEMASKAFPGAEIINPLKGCRGMGYMLRKLNKAINAGKSGVDNG